MKRTEILNAVAKATNAKRYLEIGVCHPDLNFNHVQVAEKVGVQPKQKLAGVPGVFCGTSDEYFASETPEPFDLVFVDGDHRAEQVERDVRNALKVLAPGGVVVLHDVLPTNASQGADVKPSPGASWCGTVWEVWAVFRGFKKYRTLCVDSDHGVGLLRLAPNTALHVCGDVPPWARADRDFAYNVVKPERFAVSLKEFLA